MAYYSMITTTFLSKAGICGIKERRCDCNTKLKYQARWFWQWIPIECASSSCHPCTTPTTHKVSWQLRCKDFIWPLASCNSHTQTNLLYAYISVVFALGLYSAKFSQVKSLQQIPLSSLWQAKWPIIWKAVFGDYWSFDLPQKVLQFYKSATSSCHIYYCKYRESSSIRGG